MSQQANAPLFRFGVFELDGTTGELRRKGLRVRLSEQPLALLRLLLERSGELVTREEISSALWPEGTFVDFDHGVNSAVNRIREALGDTAANPRFVETLSRRGYRFVAPVERVEDSAETQVVAEVVEKVLPEADVCEEESRKDSLEAATNASLGSNEAKELAGFLPQHILSTPEELPPAPHRVVLTLFLLLQAMYVAFYVGALANLGEIWDLISPLPHALGVFALLLVTAAILIPVRAFTLAIALFRAPGARRKLLRLWLFLLPADLLWSLAPFLLLHHMSAGLSLACTTLLVYAPFAERSLVLMGAADGGVPVKTFHAS